MGASHIYPKLDILNFNIDYTNPDYTPNDIVGYSLSVNVDAFLVGGEASINTSTGPYVVTKAGFRSPSKGANAFANWTWDLK